MRKTVSAGMGTPGASTLLVIFAVLCIFIFAILSLSGSLAGDRIADTATNAITGYYAADCEAENILAGLRNGEIPEGVEYNGGIYSYSCCITDTTSLEVEVKVSGSSFEILRWQQVYTGTWNPDEELEVWNRNENSGDK